MKFDDRLRRYVYVVLLVTLGGAAATLPIVRQGTGSSAILCLSLVVISAWYGGLGPGLLATGLIALLATQTTLTSWRLVRLILFLLGGTTISVMAEALHAARRRAEESRQALSAVLTSIGDAVIATDDRGRVTFVNPVAGSLTGWAPEEAAGRPLEEVFKLAEAGPHPPLESLNPSASDEGGGESSDADSRRPRDYHLIARDGIERPIHSSAAPIRNRDGKRLGAVLVFRDDTERREYERQLLEGSRRKDVFLAMLAHELRNPLGSIKAAVAILETPRNELHLNWAREVLNRQVGQLAHLLDDLLDVARLTHGRVVLRTVPVDAELAIRGAVEAVRPLSEERGHHVDVVSSPGLKMLEADPTRLEQVLVNLLSNAIKYTPTGGLITVSADQDGNEVVLQVADNGTGIAAEVLPIIFDLFSQGERSPARTEGGLGVGLTIVKFLVELHGGQVEVQSPGPGQGSTFTVRLPAGAPTPPPTVSLPSDSTVAKQTSRDPLKVLIIDDNEDLARSLARLLRHVGHEVRTANDGPEGLETAQAYAPDVFLLDIGLPNLDGYEVARRLRQDENEKENVNRPLIIAISGYGQDDDLRRSREAGIDHYLIKPVDIGTITSLIAQSNRG